MAMPSEAPALVDANVLVYSVFADSEHHLASRALLDLAQEGAIALCLTSQVLAEFYAVVTDARRVAVARQPHEAIQVIRDLVAMPGIMLLPIPADAVTQWLDLVARHPVSRGRIFDLQLIGSMLANGVRTIYTFDHAGFEQFSELDVRRP